MSTMPEVIDLISDTESQGASSDGEVTFEGYHRDVTQSRQHLKELEKDGWTYAGYNTAKKNLSERSIGKRKKPEVIILLDSEDEEPPLPKVGCSTGVYKVVNTSLINHRNRRLPCRGHQGLPLQPTDKDQSLGIRKQALHRR